MAGHCPEGVLMFEDIISSTFVMVPMLIGLVFVAIIGIVVYMWKSRRGPWRWSGAMRVPCVFTIEGGRKVFLIGGDKFRVTNEGDGEENKITYWESKTFGDKFPATALLPFVQYRKVGNKEIEEVLPLERLGKDVWKCHPLDYAEPIEKAVSEVRNAKTAIMIMRRGNTEFMGKNWWQENQVFVSALVIGMVFIIGLVLTFQNVTAIANGHIVAMNANTDALIALQNNTCRTGTMVSVSPTPYVFRPPG